MMWAEAKSGRYMQGGHIVYWREVMRPRGVPQPHIIRVRVRPHGRHTPDEMTPRTIAQVEDKRAYQESGKENYIENGRPIESVRSLGICT